MDEHGICRMMLKGIMKSVTKLVPVEVRKSAWEWKYDWGGGVEFHVPMSKFTNHPDFYWHGRGCCRWSARHQGWDKYLEMYYPEEYEKMEEELNKEHGIT